jgi:hypothetical protein
MGRALLGVAPVLLLSCFLFACSSSSNPPVAPVDGGSGGSDAAPHDAAAPDGGAPADASMIADAQAPDAPIASDAAPPNDAGAPCGPVSGVWAVAGGATDTVLLNIGYTTGNDGVFGPIKLGGADVRIDDVDAVNLAGGTVGLFGVGGGVLYALDRTKIPVVATVAGSVPGVEKLATGGDTMYGAGGTTIYQVGVAPVSVTALGALLDTAGCTSVRDLYVANSGGSLVFAAVLDCGGTVKLTQQTYTPSTQTFVDDMAPAGNVPADVRGMTFANRAVGDNVYTFSGSSFTAVRPVSACAQVPAGALRGAGSSGL